ncbi:ABC transporter permease [Clostridium estertheticum]|uniref:ABC transporter permease n=1 Tax=Clostridium estertheticum TaxID=238834 RepID=UPI0013E98D53|nr:ABC transporter permease [Clostridium estertheticum]MBN4049289.1 ABC transporter permease [bacterium AH-315-N14]MBZ9687122.1 ABC transporter permease [Clostridium estertheticum]
MNGMTTFLAAAIVAGTPLLFATLGEILIERAGNLNLGVEGMMLMGAVIGFLVGLNTGNVFAALLGAMVAGAFGGLIFAFLTISLRANQVVTGLALATFGSGFSTLIGKQLVGQTAPAAVKNFFRPCSIPVISDIPVIGQIFFKQDAFVYLGYILAVVIGVYLYNTSKGLNLRAIGENPGCADAASINITLYKYVHILLGGALCGLGGAYLSLVYIPNWQENVVAGRGWIAIALVIFSAWNPYKAIFGAFLFGGLDIIGFRLQGAGIQVVSQYLVDMLPYLVTIAILVIVSMKKSKRNSPPKNLGTPYFREDR